MQVATPLNAADPPPAVISSPVPTQQQDYVEPISTVSMQPLLAMVPVLRRNAAKIFHPPHHQAQHQILAQGRQTAHGMQHGITNLGTWVQLSDVELPARFSAHPMMEMIVLGDDTMGGRLIRPSEEFQQTP